MLKVIQNVECHCPQYIGKKDIWIADTKIYKVTAPGAFQSSMFTAIDGNGLSAFPGIIDAHVHIIGGGGEDGFTSRIAEIETREILEAGITTVVGLLGADDRTKGLEALLAKARAMEVQGITTYIYAGSYSVPPISITSDIESDIVLIDKVIGVKIAIADHRSSQPSWRELLRVARQAHLGGLISGKAGIVHIHIGDGKAGLNPLIEVVRESDLPIAQFVPTHVNRNAQLFQQAMDYCRHEGNIDLTSGEDKGISIPDAVGRLVEHKINLERVSLSSDSNGSIPSGGVGKIQQLYDDVVKCIQENGISPEIVFPLVTTNVAKRLKLYPQKGVLQAGSDADILLLNQNYQLKKLFAMGKLLIDRQS